jgi:8-oxo-dGTP pyrophosphatase MutT (NUDIX family)
VKRTARVIVSDGRGHFLAILQGDRKRRVAFPGGHVEPGESPSEAARRELLEETGLRVLQLQQLGRVVDDKREAFVFSAVAEGVPRRSAEGAILWVRPESFLQGHYGEFSRHALALWDRAYGDRSAG